MVEAIGVGKTIEDATEDALKKLYASREEVVIEPMEVGSKGFFGLGGKPAKVRATLRDDDRIRASVFVRNLLAMMSVQTSLDVREQGDEIFVSLGEEASPLIGHHGQTLDALQYLISRFLNGDKEDWRKVIVDIDRYRDRREDSLRSMAERFAARVIQTKRDIKTQPLSASERRIIHMALKENAGITTFSIGSGDKKRVVIALSERSPDRAASDGERRRPPRRGGYREGCSREGGSREGGSRSGGPRGGGPRGSSRRPGPRRSAPG